MAPHLVFLSVILTALFDAAVGGLFQQNYKILYGQDHIKVFDFNNTVQLSLDQSTGSGFGSIQQFDSGVFTMRIKLSPKDTTCIVTSFYLTSLGDAPHHDELDFEFIGGRSRPYILQTNVYASGVGGREQKVALWFDPTADFHNYEILWNEHHVMFAVDGIPIRVFKNCTHLGVPYPWRPMQVEATMWNGPWSCDANAKPNLSQGPLMVEYQGFAITGCPASGGRQLCNSPKLPWNAVSQWRLNPQQERAFQVARAKHFVYDYCLDRARYPNPGPECIPNMSGL